MNKVNYELLSSIQYLSIKAGDIEVETSAKVYRGGGVSWAVKIPHSYDSLEGLDLTDHHLFPVKATYPNPPIAPEDAIPWSRFKFASNCEAWSCTGLEIPVQDGYKLLAVRKVCTKEDNRGLPRQVISDELFTIDIQLVVAGVRAMTDILCND